MNRGGKGPEEEKRCLGLWVRGRKGSCLLRQSFGKFFDHAVSLIEPGHRDLTTPTNSDSAGRSTWFSTSRWRRWRFNCRLEF